MLEIGDDVARGSAFLGLLDGIEIEEDSIVKLDISDLFYDVDGDTLAYSVRSDDEINYNFNYESKVLILEPRENWNGETTIIITASDGMELAFKEIKLNGNASDHPF